MPKPFDLCAHLKRDKKHLFQKLKPIEQIDTSKLKFPMWVSEKFDGVFCCAIRVNGVIHVCSRTGEEFLSMEHLKPELDDFLRVGREKFMIFEAYIFNETQNVISGACRDTKKQHPELVALMHTLINDGDEKEVADITLPTFLVNSDISLSMIEPFLYEVIHYNVRNLDEVMSFAESIWKRGGEGAVLHAAEFQPYQAGKRNASIIKIKKGLSVDLLCVDTFKGNGKYENTLGGLVCRYKDEEIHVSGMTDAQRDAWYHNPNLIVGKIVQVDAMGESAKGKLREPRFKGIRYDKGEPDY
ncbi:hypothetical protein [Pectinatus frisingensis]|jgi:DNA ligase-1|uniref:hypothetical protein n=1 Tax=Pectinatus frisingensis TaxID=865 RepID=UPI0018C4D191|nr:hypothetical protein [Pectinatus frisingensis]